MAIPLPRSRLQAPQPGAGAAVRSDEDLIGPPTFHLAASVVDMAKRPSPPPTAEQFRKRADAFGRRLKKTANKKEQAPLRKKQQALNDMADNEDWLAGKTKR